MTRTERLAAEIKKAYLENKEAIDESISEKGPRGGYNCLIRPGWTHSISGTVTKACNMAGVPVGSWWSGSAPTPSSAIPTLLMERAMKAYNEIFGE